MNASNVRIAVTDVFGQSHLVERPFSLTVESEVEFIPAEIERIHDSVDQATPVVELEFQHTRKVWKFPHDKFIQYGPEDEGWCRGLFIGEEVEEKHLVKCRGVVKAFREDGGISVDLLAVDCPGGEVTDSVAIQSALKEA